MNVPQTEIPLLSPFLSMEYKMSWTKDKKQTSGQGTGQSEYRQRLFLKKVCLPQGTGRPCTLFHLHQQWAHQHLPQKPVVTAAGSCPEASRHGLPSPPTARCADTGPSATAQRLTSALRDTRLACCARCIVGCSVDLRQVFPLTSGWIFIPRHLPLWGAGEPKDLPMRHGEPSPPSSFFSFQYPRG